jgi:hypothetical protein
MVLWLFMKSLYFNAWRLQWFSILWQTSHKEKNGDNGCEIDNQDLKRNVKRCRRWLGNWEGRSSLMMRVGRNDRLNRLPIECLKKCVRECVLSIPHQIFWIRLIVGPSTMSHSWESANINWLIYATLHNLARYIILTSTFILTWT